MAANAGLAVAGHLAQLSSFQVSPSHHCRLHPSHLRCLPGGEGASPVSVEPRRWNLDSESPTTGDAGAHIPVTLQRAVS